MYVNNSRQPVKFKEGWLDHISEDGTWSSYWSVLQDNAILFFSSKNASHEMHVGSISLDQGSRCEKLEGNEKSGYRFEIYTRKRTNKFKTASYNDREMWKAYVDGIATRRVNHTLDLLPGQMEEVKGLLEKFFSDRPDYQAKISGSAVPGTFLLEGFDAPIPFVPRPHTPPESSDGYLVPNKTRLSQTSQKYRFYSDPIRNDIPSWFFSSCSRELAAQILNVGRAYGNTLMRENTKENNSKNLVISKKMESTNDQNFTHYIIQWTPQGYRIDVENPHEPMQSLAEVMNFFVTTSGKSSTHPMKCNDLRTLGIENNAIYNDYNKRIVTTQQDVDSGEEIVDVKIREQTRSSPDFGPPEGFAPLAPLLGKKSPKQNNSMDSHNRWTQRSQSVPCIPPEEIGRIHKAKLQNVSGASSGQHNAQISRTNFKAERLRASLDETSASTPPPIPNSCPPPLPPNHPSALKKSNSQSSGLRVTSNESPMPEAAMKISARSALKEDTHDPAPVDKTSIKKKLETILANPNIPGNAAKTRNVVTSSVTVCKESGSTEHYKNLSEI